MRSSTIVDNISVTYDQRTEYIGYLRGTLYLINGAELHLREYVDVKEHVERYTYSYHYQQSDGTLLFRYDNVEHYPNLPNFPHHKHVDDEANVVSSSAPTLEDVLAEIRLSL